jgi:hypothetical protein
MEDPGLFSTTLSFDAQLPFAFLQQDAEMLPATLARINADNQQVLGADASLAESHRPVDAKDEERPWLADLGRLEYKLDVLMGLVGKLLAQDASTPPSASLRIFAQGLEWLTRDGSPQVGTRGVVTLFINPAFPHALQLPGTVRAHRSGAEGPWAQFEFEGLTPGVTELMEKLVFRHHRRQVAESRASSHGH